MKILIAGALTLAVFIALCIPKTKKRKGIILIFYVLGMIMFFIVYNIRTIDLILKFYHPSDQVVYQKDFLKTGEYPDAFLDEFLNGRTVYTPNDAYTVDDSPDGSADDPTADVEDEESNFIDTGDYWLYCYYHAVNMWQYLEFNNAAIVKDDSLNNVLLSDEQKAYYEDLGPANDLMRYTFVLTPYYGEWGNGFYYYWFYNTFIGDSHVYICPEDIIDADELVVIWQHEDYHDTESYYIASKSFYDEVISK